jgi:hypothetical protein
MKFSWVLVLLLLGGLTRAQTESPAKRILGSAILQGVVGGESHDAFVIKAVKGQTLTLQLSWKLEDKNTASFVISRSASFFSADPINFGQFSSDHKRWVGEILSSGDYFVFVVAHPTAQYMLWVKQVD